MWVLLFEQFLHNDKEPMLFHTGMFLFLFAVFLIAYSYLFNKPVHRSLLLILFGFYFYYKASGVFLFLLLLTISADFFFAGKIVHESDPKKKKMVVDFRYTIQFIIFTLFQIQKFLSGEFRSN